MLAMPINCTTPKITHIVIVYRLLQQKVCAAIRSNCEADVADADVNNELAC